MDVSKLTYTIKNDIEFYMEASGLKKDEIFEVLQISKSTLYEILSNKPTTDDVCEKVYSAIYKNKIHLNSVKSELLQEISSDKVLFHGSKTGLSKITYNGSRENCDFGKGFYLGETYRQALSFVCENEKSSIYSFCLKTKNLKIYEFNVDLDWMLAICYFRKTLPDIYCHNSKIQEIIKRIDKADLIIAPIADNRMFYIMSKFSSGEINEDVAKHSLSALDLGKQYILKTTKAINNLKPQERFYLSSYEKVQEKINQTTRSMEVDTKLKLCMRKYKDGLYIDEVLK